jgi:peptidyl-tRNA hydrolase
MKPILFILMRSDLESMNPGKAMAQAAHAATAFERKIHGIMRDDDEDSNIENLYNEWRNSTSQGFGTKVVLDAIDEAGISGILFDAMYNKVPVHDTILDPTYPLRDGKVTHYIPLVTCGYVFTDAVVWSPNKKFSLFK